MHESNNVWIGCQSTLLKGSNIPNGSIIGACSLVSKSAKLNDENSIYAGSPPILIKSGYKWSKDIIG